MQEYEKGSFRLELREVIKVNQLVRNQINFGEFKAWYTQLSKPEQYALTSTLLEFAYQAGVDVQVWEEVNIVSSRAINQNMIQTFKSFHLSEIGLHDWSGFQVWQNGLSDSEKEELFALAVYLFGTAEGRVYQKEQKEWCNHWWHRDLSDARVVEAILANPQFYKTAMKDDEAIQR